MSKNLSNKLIKFFFLTTLVVILIMSLSSCNLFEERKEVNNVSIELGTGLIDSNNDGVYEIMCGKEFTLISNWHNSLKNSPSIKWYISIGSNQKEEINNSNVKALSYTFTKYVDDICTFTVCIDGVDSLNYNAGEKDEYASIKVKPQYATLDLTNVEIQSINYPIIQGVVQLDLNKVNIKNIELTADYNKDIVDPSWDVKTTWKIGSNQYEQESLTLKLSDYLVEQSFKVTVEISCTNDENKSSNSITISFVKNYLTVDSVSLSLSSNEDITNIKGVTYYIEGLDETNVEISATVNPEVGTNLSHDCVWTRTSSNGTNVINVTSRTASIPLKYGKNTIKATIDNVESRHIVIYLLSSIDFNNRKNAIEDTFIWNGNQQDHYINNQQDLNDMFGYSATLHKTISGDSLDDPNSINYYLAPSEWRDDLDELKKALANAATIGLDESGTFSYTFSATRMGFTKESNFGIPSGACDNTWDITQENIETTLKISFETRELPIDSFKESVDVFNSNDLYRAVSNGYKPVIKDSALQTLYNKARQVLQYYVTDDMSDVDKVRAIYEWLIVNVDYDKDTLESKSKDRTSYNSFYLEGVFNDGRAVCDGKSKAFTLLCGMEGIKALRIIGYANEKLANHIAIWEGNGATEAEIRNSLSKAGYGHAWNKVLLDANNDGIKEWYIVDTTWGDVSILGDDNKAKEYLTYDYFLKSDKDLERTHYSEQNQPACTTSFNAYLNTYINYNDENISLNVTSTVQANKLIQYSEDNGNIKIVIVDSNNIFKKTNVLLDIRANWSVLGNSNAVIIWCA